MKRVLSLTLSILLVLASLGMCAFADEAPTSADVYVTIINKGTFEMTREKITVTETDTDGALTISDALYLAHEAKYDGGAEAGWSTYTGDYGLSIGKLWGDTSGNFGYYVNNASAWSPADTVKNGDSITAFIYAGEYPNLESYSYFQVDTVSAKQGDTVELTLCAAGYDEEWNPVSLPVEGAIITIDGEATSYVTNGDGKVSVKLETVGRSVISAVCEATPIVPPVCIATVIQVSVPSGSVDISEINGQTDTQTEAQTDANSGGCGGIITLTGITVLTAAGACALTFKKRKDED